MLLGYAIPGATDTLGGNGARTALYDAVMADVVCRNGKGTCDGVYWDLHAQRDANALALLDEMEMSNNDGRLYALVSADSSLHQCASLCAAAERLDNDGDNMTTSPCVSFDYNPWQRSCRISQYSAMQVGGLEHDETVSDGWWSHYSERGKGRSEAECGAVRLRDGAGLVSSCAGPCEISVALELVGLSSLNTTTATDMVLSGGGLASNGSTMAISNGSILTMRGNGFVMDADVELRGNGHLVFGPTASTATTLSHQLPRCVSTAILIPTSSLDPLKFSASWAMGAYVRV